MRKLITAGLFVAAMTMPALAGQAMEGDAVLKDLQPAGVANRHVKHQKHEVYDLTFDAAGNEYTCRTNPDKSMNPTDFVVGSSVHFAIDGRKVKISTPDNKRVSCSVVRVARASAAVQ